MNDVWFFECRLKHTLAQRRFHFNWTRQLGSYESHGSPAKHNHATLQCIAVGVHVFDTGATLTRQSFSFPLCLCRNMYLKWRLAIHLCMEFITVAGIGVCVTWTMQVLVTLCLLWNVLKYTDAQLIGFLCEPPEKTSHWAPCRSVGVRLPWEWISNVKRVLPANIFISLHIAIACSRLRVFICIQADNICEMHFLAACFVCTSRKSRLNAMTNGISRMKTVSTLPIYHVKQIIFFCYSNMETNNNYYSLNQNVQAATWICLAFCQTFALHTAHCGK